MEDFGHHKVGWTTHSSSTIYLTTPKSWVSVGPGNVYYFLGSSEPLDNARAIPYIIIFLNKQMSKKL